MKNEVSQADEPCVIHAYHRPVTVVNELHHPFPQGWQREVWGEVRDTRTVSVCATGHNTIHAALRHWERYGNFPDYCIGRTRDLVEEAVMMLAAARQ